MECKTLPRLRTRTFITLTVILAAQVYARRTEEWLFKNSHMHYGCDWSTEGWKLHGCHPLAQSRGLLGKGPFICNHASSILPSPSFCNSLQAAGRRPFNSNRIRESGNSHAQSTCIHLLRTIYFPVEPCTYHCR